jgi:mannose-1-phosphate guanylyltransferase
MTSTPDAVILCGGEGSRLRGVSGSTPKSMVTIAGRPFLELLLRQLRRNGFTRVILAVGYRMDAIRSHFGDSAFDMSLHYSEETSPLGTGGALRNATGLIQTESALVMNGDSYTTADLGEFSSQHRAATTDLSVLVVPADERLDCGLVSLAGDGRVLGFKEKQSLDGSRHLNTGIYMVNRSLLQEIPSGRKISLEEELFPQWLAGGKHIKAYAVPGQCVDIGTPERYQSAQNILASVELKEPPPLTRN